MDIRVSGHQIDTGEALQTYVADRLNAMVEKYFSRALSSQVTFGKGAHGAFTSDIVTHVNKGLILKSHGDAQDVHLSFDQAAEKLDKQLRRYKRRIQDRHTQAAFSAAEEEAAYTVFAASGGAGNSGDHEAADAPPVIAETTADIPEASVADAVMMLDLRDTGALLFKNAGTGAHNMVYRRRDGSIGWSSRADRAGAPLMTLTGAELHYRALERLYVSAPVNGLFASRLEIVGEGQSKIRFAVTPATYHAAGAAHGTIYFKMLDDAAFYAANTLATDRFLLTTSFNLHFTKPVREGEVMAEGRWVSGRKRVFVAEARLVDSEGEEIGRGTGTFMRSRIALSSLPGYRAGES